MKSCRLDSGMGFSLIEVVAAMAAGLVILGVALQSVVYFQREFARQHAHVMQEQDVRLGLELFQQELRLAASGSLAVVASDVIEFTANINNLVTNATAPVAAGQTTVAVEDGRGWPDGKAVRICWNDQCVDFTLARSGQRNLLTFVEPAPRSIPSGASAVVMNRVRYYSRPDERGMLRWLRQIDGGASVIAGNIAAFTVRYWDAQGRPVTHPDSVRRVQAEISLPGRTVAESREITLRT
jgi:type II secretory pathway pseudopilin PulG